MFIAEYLWDSISIQDTAVRKNQKENFYHGLVLGLLQSCGDWRIRSNTEAGEGYSDIVIYTHDRVGVVIEINRPLRHRVPQERLHGCDRLMTEDSNNAENLYFCKTGP